MDPQINTLVPVLKSPWLMFHVAVIVAAYGFFGISFLLGMTNLLLMSFRHTGEQMSLRIRELSIINNLSLLSGLALMTIGTFLGAVWANESWGRYWGWDPKETWALITVVIYSIVTHLHLVKRWQSEWLFNALGAGFLLRADDFPRSKLLPERHAFLWSNRYFSLRFSLYCGCLCRGRYPGNCLLQENSKQSVVNIFSVLLAG